MPDKTELYRDKFYVVDITLPKNDPTGLLAGTTVTASVTVQNVPFIAKRCLHAIIGANLLVNNPPTALADYSQDGQYRIRFRKNDFNYMNAPVSALAGFGGGQFSQPIDLAAPIEFRPNDTIAFEVTNDVLRLGGITIQVGLEGVEPYEG